MKDIKTSCQWVSYKLPVGAGWADNFMWKKLRAGFFLVLGFLLSPLCWWNDLLFNLPIAYCCGYVLSLISEDLFLPSTIAAYWMSNIVGILLMQAGAIEVWQQNPKERNLRKELLTGVVSSTAYTILILGLMQFKILHTPDLFPMKIL